MALIVMGAKQKQGTYEGRAYDNISIVAMDTESRSSSLLFGSDVEIIKIKTSDFMMALGKNSVRGFNKAQDIEGAIIEPVYNKFGNCIDFTVYASDTPETKNK